MKGNQCGGEVRWTPPVHGAVRQSRNRLLCAVGSVALVSPLGLATSCGGSTAVAAPVVTTTELARRDRTTSGGAIAMPSGPLQVIATRYDIPPGAMLPRHLHPAPRYAFVQSGSLEVTNVQTGTTRTFNAGDFVAEDVNVWHRARNVGAEDVRLLVLDIAPPGSANVVKGEAPKRQVPSGMR